LVVLYGQFMMHGQRNIKLHKILSNILLRRLTSYTEEIIGDHQRGFRRSRSNTDHIFWIRQILEKKGNTRKQCNSSS